MISFFLQKVKCFQVLLYKSQLSISHLFEHIEDNFILNELQLICLNSGIAIASLQLLLSNIIFLFNINHLSANSKRFISIANIIIL